jgi:hypothetical protein
LTNVFALVDALMRGIFPGSDPILGALAARSGVLALHPHQCAAMIS